MFKGLLLKILFLSLTLIWVQSCSQFSSFDQNESYRHIANVDNTRFSYRPKGTTIAIGDVHGDPESFIDALVAAGVMNKKGKFVGENIDLVLLGDYANKGHNTMGVWDIIHFLKRKSKKRNSRVHAVFGNHDTVVLMGDLTRTKPHDLENFKIFDEDPKRGLQKALISEPYQEMMAGWKSMVRVGDDIFVHGGLDKWILDTTPEEMNQIVHDFVIKQQEYLKASLTDPNLKAPEVPWVIKPWVFDSDSPMPDNPFWSRQMSKNKLSKKEVKEILDHVGAKRMIVGHTPTSSKEIETLYGGRLVKADTGNSRAFKKGQVSVVKISENGETEFINKIKRGKNKKAYKKIYNNRGDCQSLLNAVQGF